MSGFAVSKSSALTVEPQLEVGEAQPVPFWDAVTRSADFQFNVRRNGVQAEQMRDALWRRQRAIETAAGVKLRPSDTMNDGPNRETAGSYGPLVGNIARGVNIAAELLGVGHSDADYEAEVERLRAANPKALQGVETRQQLEARLQAGWKAKGLAASEAAQAHPVGAFVGGSAAALADPVNITATALTGGAGAGRPLLLRMLAQGAANAGVVAAQAPQRMLDAERFGGPAYGASDAAADIAMAGVGGAAFEGAAAGVKAVARPLISHIGGRDARISAVSADGAPKRAGELLERMDRDEAAIGAQSGADVEEAAASLDRFEPPPLAPARDLSEVVPEPAAGGLTQADYRGRRIYGGSFDPRELAADPVRFQYKADGDAEGVTARLKGVDAWDATASGKVIVWEDRAGQRFIADGHQRRGLALRMEEKGWDARLDGYLLREADGWTAPEVRTVAALKNIREGSGAPLDAAKVLRDAPDAIHDRSLPVSGEFMAQARGLAQLSDPAFKAAVNKVISERFAAEIGQLAATRPDLHEPMVRLIKEADPANVDEARALVVEALQDDWLKSEGDQADLFGYDPSVSAMIARAKIAATVKRSLARDARLFGQLIRHADAIEAGGNALARDANEARLAVDRAALEVTAKLALRAGPVGEAMQAAVAKVHAGEPPATAARDVISQVRKAIEAGERLDAERGFALDPAPPSPHAQALVEKVDEPAFREAQAKVAAEDAEEAPGLFDDLVEDERPAKARELLAASVPGE